MAINARAVTGCNSVDAQAAESAILILHTFAFLHYENIMEAILERAAGACQESSHGDNVRCHLSQMASYPSCQLLQLDKEGSWDALFFRKGIRVLLSFSLVKRGPSGTVYSVHPLVHSWSQDRMSKLDFKNMCYSASALLSCSITLQFTSHDYAFCQTLIPHINANYQYAAAAGVIKAYNEDECENFALVYGESGYWKEAEKLYVQVMETRKRVLGEEHPDTLKGIVNLASTYWKQGYLKEAEELEVHVMKISLKVLGKEHLDTLTSMGNLASTYQNQGQWKEAEQLEVQVLETRKRVLEVEHPHTLKSMGNLASTYRHQGRWKEAQELEVQVMETSLKVLGVEHPDTLTSIASLASTYRSHCQWKDAEDLLVQVMETRKRVLGVEHPDTLTSMGDLASTYQRQSQWKEAEELLVQVMETRMRVLGVEHRDTLQAWH